MNAGVVIGLVLIFVGVILFAIGASGTVSMIQVGIGIFLAGVGAIALVKAIRS